MNDTNDARNTGCLRRTVAKTIRKVHNSIPTNRKEPSRTFLDLPAVCRATSRSMLASIVPWIQPSCFYRFGDRISNASCTW